MTNYDEELKRIQVLTARFNFLVQSLMYIKTVNKDNAKIELSALDLKLTDSLVGLIRGELKDVTKSAVTLEVK